jgi:hypothetical protein
MASCMAKPSKAKTLSGSRFAEDGSSMENFGACDVEKIVDLLLELSIGGRCCRIGLTSCTERLGHRIKFHPNI